MKSSPEICAGVIERLLKIKVGRIEYPEVEKTISPFYEGKGVRLDVYVKDTDRVFDIEIQTYKQEALPLRTRYYQSLVDCDALLKGQDYTELKESYVIFICLDDPLTAGLPLYTFQNLCTEDKTIALNDGSYKVFANAAAHDKEKDVELRAFLEYLKRRKATSDFTRRIDGIVADIKLNEKFRGDYIAVNLHERDITRAAKKEGRAEQKAEDEKIIAQKDAELERLRELLKANGIESK